MLDPDKTFYLRRRQRAQVERSRCNRPSVLTDEPLELLVATAGKATNAPELEYMHWSIVEAVTRFEAGAVAKLARCE